MSGAWTAAGMIDVEEEVIAKSFKDVNIEPKNSSSIDGFIEQVRNIT
jgi:hypothetical protein